MSSLGTISPPANFQSRINSLISGGGDTGYTYNMLHTATKTVAAIKTIFQSGHFYFCYSTVKWGFGENIQFIGQNGTVLKAVSGNISSYTSDGTEGYIRTKITKSAGDTTWT